jgi:hypothetical protein
MDVASERGHVALTILVILDWAAAASRRWAIPPAAWLTSPNPFPGEDMTYDEWLAMLDSVKP